MTTSKHVVCPHCDGTNRVPVDRLLDHPKCGRCHEPLFEAKPLDLAATNFQRHIANNDIPVLVDFWAPWCGPCKMMVPVFAQAAAMFDGRMRIAKLNTEEHPAVASRYGIRAIPTLIMFRAGREVDRVAGALAPSQLTDWIRRHL